MSAIKKTVFTFTVLHSEGDQPVDLAHAMAEAYDGNMVGLETDCVTQDIPDNQVSTELVALGNDGSFFDIELGLTE